MIDTFEYKGIWWLPGKQTEARFGILTFAEGDGVYLEIFPAFKQKGDTSYSNYDLIHGQLANGKPVTLQKCSEIGQTLNFPGMHTSKFMCQKALLGCLLQSEDEFKFTRILVSFSHFETWIRMSGLILPNAVLSNAESKSPKVEYQNLPSVQLGTINGFLLKIDFSLLTEAVLVGSRRISLTERALLVIESQTGSRPLHEFLNLIFDFQYFLCVACREPIFILSIQCHPIEIYFNTGYVHAKKTVAHSDMLFMLPDVRQNLTALVDNWMKIRSTLKPITQLYLSLIYNPKVVHEFQFLSLVHALEGYHRMEYGGRYESDDTFHEGLYQKLTSLVRTEVTEKNFKEALESKMFYLNQYSLQKRLKDLMKDIPDSLLALIGVNKSSRDKFIEFIKEVKDSRNSLTHYDKDSQETQVDPRDIYILTIKCKLLLEICLVRKMGLRYEDIEKFMKNSQNTNYSLKGEWV